MVLFFIGVGSRCGFVSMIVLTLVLMLWVGSAVNPNLFEQMERRRCLEL